ncbi:MAG: anthranilate synthase component I family protein [Planctomycetales bacterium]
MVPAVEELKIVPSPAGALQAFAGSDGLILFDSALQRGRLGRYSFLAADPIATFNVERAEYSSDPFASVRATVARLNGQFQLKRLPDLPPFQGGVAGMLSYELGGCWERIPRTGKDEFELPDAWFGIYDWVIAWDHQQDRAWVISHGLPKIDIQNADQAESSTCEVDQPGCADRAAVRIQDVVAKLSSSDKDRTADTDGKVETQHRNADPLPESELAKQHALPGWDGVTSDFTREDYLTAVERVIEYIHAGDIFQANLSQRLLARCDVPPTELYSTLRDCNPAPFAGFLTHDDWAIVSASPERFLRVENGVVETRPIKGTRQRRTAPEADLFTRDELRQSEKDVAENVMIVDLLRNDLSRVCEPGSISVPELCVVETYETVQHLVSEIRGTLKKGKVDGEQKSDIWSLLAASFPGGSITGAPKVRAVEIISELEPTVRGPYCGSLFYYGFDGTFDSSILIRSFVCRRGWVQCRVGGGIVAQSEPTAEYEETLHKAEGMLRALQRSGLCQPIAK